MWPDHWADHGYGWPEDRPEAARRPLRREEKEWTVTWTIQVPGATPEEAAQTARDMQLTARHNTFAVFPFREHRKVVDVHDA